MWKKVKCLILSQRIITCHLGKTKKIRVYCFSNDATNDNGESQTHVLNNLSGTAPQFEVLAILLELKILTIITVQLLQLVQY